MFVCFLPPLPPPPEEPESEPERVATFVILALVAILILPFAWAHQTRSKWPPRAVVPSTAAEAHSTASTP